MPLKALKASFRVMLYPSLLAKWQVAKEDSQQSLQFKQRLKKPGFVSNAGYGKVAF